MIQNFLNQLAGTFLQQDWIWYVVSIESHWKLIGEINDHEI